jgi:aldose 1-epimerase
VTAPSGLQVEIATGDQRAWLTEVGAGLRRYVVAGRDVLDGYGEDEMSSSGRGQLLLPWPNRIADGRYSFGGRDLQLPLTEPSSHTAIHGLVRWVAWGLREQEDDRALFELHLHPQPGYPFALDLEAEYALGADGLTVRLAGTNAGDAPCPFGAGAHPYLRPAAGPTVDTAVLRSPAATRLLNDDRGIPTGREPVEGTPYDFREPRPIGDLQLDTAFTDLERGADGRATVQLDDTVLCLGEGFDHLMLFTGDPLPNVARRSLGVEPMTCAPNAYRSGDGLLTLAPGETWSASFGIFSANAS